MYVFRPQALPMPAAALVLYIYIYIYIFAQIFLKPKVKNVCPGAAWFMTSLIRAGQERAPFAG
jgi:hypothetical protein